jgi:transcriptional antiterminator RfaH
VSVVSSTCAVPDHEVENAWYVVQTKRQQEFRALEHLRNQGFRCSLPTVPGEKMRRGRLVLENEPLFTRYLFIELRSDLSNSGGIRSTRGVTRLVSFGGVPARLPREWIEEFDRRGAEPRRLFEMGQRVVLTEGPFAGLEGIYQMADGDARAIVMMTLLNKPAKGTFPVAALRRAG